MKQRTEQGTAARSATGSVGIEPLQYHVVICRRSDSNWGKYTSHLERSGFPVPAFALPSFPPSLGQLRTLAVLEREDGEVVWAAVAEVGRSRVLPWRRIIRIPRFGPGVTSDFRECVVNALVDLAVEEHALRVHVEVFEPDPDRRLALTNALAHRAFKVAMDARSYSSTVFIDLRVSEAELLSSFHSKTRRDIRAIAKYPLECRPITDPSLARRMNELLGVSMTRTGGRFEETRWVDVLGFIAANPTRAALLGVYRTDIAGAEALVGYVLGYRHGDTVEYSIAACARLADIRAPLLYAPTWELMRWGKRNGAIWFDFGGITSGSRASGDRAGGISDFKRYFSPEVTPVGADMVFSPVPRLSSFAASVSTLISRLSRRRRSVKSRSGGSPQP